MGHSGRSFQNMTLKTLPITPYLTQSGGQHSSCRVGLQVRLPDLMNKNTEHIVKNTNECIELDQNAPSCSFFMSMVLNEYLLPEMKEVVSEQVWAEGCIQVSPYQKGPS